MTDEVPKYHESWPERLKWAQEEGLKNLQEKFTTGDNMNKEAQTTLTYILTGMGGTFALMSKGLEAPLTGLVFANVALFVWFSVLGFFLVALTMRIGAFPAPYQDPQNILVRPDLSIDQMRSASVTEMEKRIASAQRWIRRKSRVINWIRGLLLGSPVVFVLALLSHHCLK